MKNVFIDAYTRLNLGDDLFVKVLCDRYPETQFTIASREQYAAPFRSIDNLEVVTIPRYIDGIMSRMNLSYRTSSRIKNKQARKNDATVIIGGSIFIEPDNWQEHVKKNQDLVDQSEHMYILGSNFGPYHSEAFYQAYEKLFATLEDVCFRDASSYTKFEHLPTVRTAPDVVFSMDTKTLENVAAEKSVVISVIDLSWRKELAPYQEGYEQSILDLSKELIAKGYQVVLMSFCQYEGDEAAIHRILNRADNEKLTYYFYDGNIEESLQIIQKSSGVVATRFHSMILGWILEKPVFPFIYSNKTLNVLHDLAYDGYSLEIADIASIDLNKAVAQTIKSDPMNVQAEIEKAQENFLKFDLFMAE